MKKLFVLFVLLITLTSCAAYNPIETPKGTLDTYTVSERVEVVEEHRDEPAGFWKGLWHGIVLPFAFVGKMFNGDIGLYETYNTGNWYNFGFIFGLSVWVGGSSTSKKR